MMERAVMDDPLIEVGAKLKAARMRKNVTQALLAEASGLSIDTVQRAEKGEIYPKSLAKMADALGMKLIINLGPLE